MDPPRRYDRDDTCGAAFRFTEEHTGLHIAKIMPGNFCVTTRNEILSTTLGSCVAVCLQDKAAGVVGMNHYLLPNIPATPESASSKQTTRDNRYGEQAMNSLIAGMIECGARKEHLISKVFGGARILDFSESIGMLNARFAESFLLQAGIPIRAFDVGGTVARKIILEPGSGRVRVLKLTDNTRESIVSTEKRLFETAASQ